ncbi:MAG TPA: serine/threonine protein kinase [Azospirillaceae bacterium]|nr:serine/threonine protein kinase [Azospirillaceae bacterium]
MATAAQTADASLEFPPVDLGGRGEILPAAPLPGFDGPGGHAYVFRSARERRTDQYAVVCRIPAPPRIEALSALRAMEHPSLVRVTDWATVDWTPDRARRFAICFERPSGRPLMETLDEMRDPLPEDQLVRGVLASLLSGLKELSRAGLTCGGVRPTNLFVKDANATSVLIGDFVSGPAGYAQPVLFETVERGIAQRSGRGPGSIADDLYALGVTLLVLALGRSPVRGLDDNAVRQMKMERGTWATLTAQTKVPQNLVEPLRGLTTDDAKQRWSLNDLDMWMQGRRLSPKQPQVARRAQRPLEFDGQELWNVRTVAHALSRNVPAATQVIGSGELDRWLRRALNEELKAELVQQAINSAAAGRPGSVEDRIVARVCIALDPTSPIRYKGCAVMPDGIGTALAEAMRTGEGLQALAEIVLFQMVGFWVNCYPDFRPEHVPLVQTYDSLRSLLEQTGPGFGIERVLYEVAPAVPCLSLQVRDQYALTLPDLMAALDGAGSRPSRGRDPVDRHVAGFVAAHHRKLHDRLLSSLAPGGDPVQRVSGMLALLVEVQRRFGPPKLPGLADWLVVLAEPLFKRFHNRRTRERLKHEAQRVARDGHLEPLVHIIDDPKVLAEDQHGFAKAMRQHDALSQQIANIRLEMGDRGGITATTGRQIAAVASSVVAMVILVLIVIVMAGGGL